MRVRSMLEDPSARRSSPAGATSSRDHRIGPAVPDRRYLVAASKGGYAKAATGYASRKVLRRQCWQEHSSKVARGPLWS
jgi:hypothetical protein